MTIGIFYFISSPCTKCIHRPCVLQTEVSQARVCHLVVVQRGECIAYNPKQSTATFGVPFKPIIDKPAEC